MSTRSYVIRQVFLIVVLAAIVAIVVRQPELAPPLAPLVYLCAIALAIQTLIRSAGGIPNARRAAPAASAPLIPAGARPAGRGGLKAGDILGLEFEYARETAAQAMSDRQALVNFYLAISGALPTAVAILLSQGMPPERLQDYRPFGVWALWALVVVGWLFFLKMVRLRQAHLDSIVAMNDIKDFYLDHAEGFAPDELAQAFRWRTDTAPNAAKKWTIFFLSAGLIAFLNSLTFALGGLLLEQSSPVAPGYGSDRYVHWAAFAAYGLLMLALHVHAYNALLASPKGGATPMSTPDRKPARPNRRVEILEQARDYDGFFKVDRVRLRFERFDGTLSEPVTRQVLERGDSVCVLPYDPERDTVLLVQQFRYPAYVRNGPGWLWEIVAGVQDRGRDRVTVARAELMEEAGYQVDDLAPIAQFYPSPGGSSERMYLYLAYISPSAHVAAGGGLTAEQEDIQIRLFPLPEALRMAESGEICDAKTLIALQWLALHKGSLPRYVKL